MNHYNLNIQNYSYEDLLQLFDIQQLDKQSLKYAYKSVIKTHPDKSGLDKSIFIFFSKAFKYLKQIYDTHQKQTTYSTSVSNNNSITYTNEDIHDKSNDVFIEQLQKKKINNHEFSKWFNDIFDKIKLNDTETDEGYDQWLRSNEDINNEQIHSIQQMNDFISKKKTDIRQIVPFDQIQTTDTIDNTSYNIARTKVDNYSSPLFSKLGYEDLKKAHTESVIPISQEDFRSTNFNNVNDLMNQRSKIGFNFNEHENIANNQQKNEQQDNIHRQYKLIQQMEETKKAQDTWWSHLKQITN